MHVAANKGHDYTVKWLHEKDASISIKDKEGVSMSILRKYGR